MFESTSVKLLIEELYKNKKGYPNSKQLMTLGTDINDVNKDILTFLNDLTW